ncbi:TRAP transporter substrate-binding protein DctP [Mesorhizobium marinum]|uniref:TRAP transporter substrate-binding protein DctP n=1 Tax=Mesorhizobium marinum TaxID=3228790 RepID=UPI003466332C
MLRTLSITAGLVALGLSAPASAQTTFQIGHSLSPNSHYQVGAQTFADLVAERTNGRYRIEIAPGGSLGSEREMVEGVQLGTVDMVLTSMGTVGAFVPETLVLDLPFLFNDAAHARAVIDGEIGAGLLEAVEAKGFRPLAWAENGVPGFVTRDRAIAKAEDLSGLKMRVQANELHTATFEAMGSQGVPLGFGEIYTAMQTGAIDGTYMVVPIVVTSNFWQVQSHMTMAPLFYQAAMFIMAPSAWDQLDDADRAIFVEAAREAGVATRNAVEKAEAEGLATLREHGMTIATEYDRASFDRALAPVYERFADRIDPALVEKIRQQGN